MPSCPHQNQILHNRKFHEVNVQTFPNDFFDWKTTCLFYIALHYIKALARKRNKDIGESHFDIRSNINPLSKKDKPTMQITRGAYELYDLLYESSRNARYPGITNVGLFKAIMEDEHRKAQEILKKLILYCEDQGLNVENLTPATQQKKEVKSNK